VALISLVVPVYEVEAYVRPCLDSILAQTFEDLELIVVDDHSSDRCGEIADEYAAHDRRVRALHLEANSGLGRARNAGLALATGEYTWFVDGDDWLADDAMRAVVARLTETDPDVLVVDHARAYLDGSTKRNRLAAVLHEAPEVFAIDEYPRLLENFGVAWNKVVRTDFLRETRLFFPTGWYEDIPFTFPLLDRARRLSTLDRVCVYYRQRRLGSILGSRSERHIELFDQYERAFGLVGPGPVREHLRGQALGHGLLVLDAPGRVPPHRRKAFRRRLAQFQHRNGLEPRGWKQRVLLAGAWRIAPYRKRMKLRGGWPRGDWKRKLRRLPGLAYYWWQRRKPLQDLAVYSSYWGRAYECSPAAIHAKAAELAPHVRGVWLVTEEHAGHVPSNVDYVIIGSLAYYRALARARWAIYNDNLEGEIVKRPGTIHLQTHHGTPLKHMGVDEPGVDVDKLLKRCDRWDYNLSANRYATEIWQRAYPAKFQTLEFGLPRNDSLVHAPLVQGRTVLYAPTFRPGGVPEPPPLKGFDVVVKQHYFHDPRSASINELMLAASALITDYSSVMFDFALLDRPIVIYAPDWESYVDSRGVYFDLMREPPGPVATTAGELQRIFATGEVWGYEQERKAFRERFCQFEDGRAAERVVRRLFLGEAP
jgi:CDP-glycerol glycerophosphotransferase